MNTKNTNTKLEAALRTMVDSFTGINEALEAALRTMVDSFTGINEALETMTQEIEQLRTQVKDLNEQVKAQELDNLPDWVDAATAMKMLNIKDVDTLRAYAKRGLITQQRGADRKNYYPKSEVLSLPGKLVELGALESVK